MSIVVLIKNQKNLPSTIDSFDTKGRDESINDNSSIEEIIDECNIELIQCHNCKREQPSLCEIDEDCNPFCAMEFFIHPIRAICPA